MSEQPKPKKKLRRRTQPVSATYVLPRLYSTEEAAAYFKVSIQTIGRWVNHGHPQAGKLGCVTVGKTRIFQQGHLIDMARRLAKVSGSN